MQSTLAKRASDEDGAMTFREIAEKLLLQRPDHVRRSFNAASPIRPDCSRLDRTSLNKLYLMVLHQYYCNITTGEIAFSAKKYSV